MAWTGEDHAGKKRYDEKPRHFFLDVVLVFLAGALVDVFLGVVEYDTYGTPVGTISSCPSERRALRVRSFAYARSDLLM